MALPKVNPSQTAAWQQIQSHFEKMQATSMKDLFVLMRIEQRNFTYNGMIFFFILKTYQSRNLRFVIEFS